MRLPPQLFKRKKDSHKNDFGHLFILAGSVGMGGAALLAAKAALRTGAGLVTIGLPESVAFALTGRVLEEMILPLPQTTEGSIALLAFPAIDTFLKKADVLLVGPGLSRNAETQKLIRKVTLASRIKTLIDADGINAWDGSMNQFKVCVSCLSQEKDCVPIMTPHPGEMARLLETSVNKIQAKRSVVAKDFSKEYNVVTVLKGSNTVITDPSGKFALNPTGNSGMSTAGAGDVLSGIIAALWAQRLSSFDAAKYGAYLHGLAGDLAAKEMTELGLIASDIVHYIPKAIKKSKR